MSRTGDDSMAQKTQQEQLEELSLERDSYKLDAAGAWDKVGTLHAELAFLRKAAAEHDEAQQAEFAVQIARIKAACPPPESPISVNWNMLGKYEEPFQITLRAGVTGEIIIDVMKARSEFLDVALKGGYKFSEKPKPAPAAKENKAVAILKEAGATPQVIAAATQATAHVKPGLEIHAVHMMVEPKPGGKVNVSFFGNDRKHPHNQFADIYVSRSAEQLAKDMAFLDPEVFTGPGEYAVELIVGYTLSDKLNTKGNPYKDIQYIKSA